MGKRGAWVVQSVEHPTLDFGSSHDLMVHGIKPHVRLCTDSAEPVWDSLFPSLTAPPSLKISKQRFFSKRKWARDEQAFLQSIHNGK